MLIFGVGILPIFRDSRRSVALLRFLPAQRRDLVFSFFFTRAIPHREKTEDLGHAPAEVFYSDSF